MAKLRSHRHVPEVFGFRSTEGDKEKTEKYKKKSSKTHDTLMNPSFPPLLLLQFFPSFLCTARGPLHLGSTIRGEQFLAPRTETV